MIEPGIIGQVEQRPGRSSFWIITAEHNCGDPGQNYCAHAHYTGFKGDIQGSLKQPPGTELPGGFSDGNQFGVTGRVLGCFTQIVPPGNDCAVADNDAPDRNLVFALCLIRFSDSATHPVFVAAGWGGICGVSGE